ncbi:uncharacterized protein LOC135120039 [Zophobas morio]|uniref:uncharacterized protein LOC135120039 n=1 Tax=Zophobas morio TaxID=2755281 RepID=UPI0030832E4E
MALKYFIFVLIACPFLINGKVELPPEFLKWAQQLHTDCATERKLSEGDIKSFDISKKDAPMMCYVKCLFTHARWVDENEVVQTDFIKNNVPDPVKSVTLPNLDTCAKKAVGADCEKSYNFFMCMHEAFPEDWVLL